MVLTSHQTAARDRASRVCNKTTTCLMQGGSKCVFCALLRRRSAASGLAGVRSAAPSHRPPAGLLLGRLLLPRHRDLLPLARARVAARVLPCAPKRAATASAAGGTPRPRSARTPAGIQLAGVSPEPEPEGASQCSARAKWDKAGGERTSHGQPHAVALPPVALRTSAHAAPLSP